MMEVILSNEVTLSASLNTVVCPTTDIGQVVILKDDDTQLPIDAVAVDEGTNCPVCKERIDAINAAVPTVRCQIKN
ncbi:hypothetical protein DPMN_099214 [Dreissena polymorpha]|uniref:Uncharacterized protein n=1 Tax=Dreissena polymorpha TaxID=45954 RepID=A0A9D4R7F8_DREPO|nr:hypothetical protein DPMN_099214 [Dreissena polymorpha]